VVPLFQSSLRRATYLGYALESRCYGFAVPRVEGLRLGRPEAALLAISSACLVSVILLQSGLK
jgi:energy-coupling factor transporter transmembrane protein EcfT